MTKFPESANIRIAAAKIVNAALDQLFNDKVLHFLPNRSMSNFSLAAILMTHTGKLNSSKKYSMHLQIIIFPVLRTLRFLGRLFETAGYGELPTVADGHEPEPETKSRAHDRCHGRWKSQHVTADDHGRTSQSGNGIKLGSQDHWNLSQQHVTRHTSTDPRQHAKKCAAITGLRP